MALLAEELVEEWLNRQGYFTIRGAKIGNHEMDLLAVRYVDGEVECRHIEVQVSITPISHITSLTKEDVEATGMKARSAKKRASYLAANAAKAWVERKFTQPKKQALLQSLFPGPWSREFVVHNVKHPEELDLIAAEGVTILHLRDVLVELAQASSRIEKAGGRELLELIWLGKLVAPLEPAPQATEGEANSD